MTPLALALLLSGCTTTVRFPPDQGLFGWESDTGGAAAGATVTQVWWGCDDADTAWEWGARTEGWTTSASLDIFRSDREEAHLMRIAVSDPAGWDELHLGPLPDATPPEQWRSETNTVFDCSADRATLTFAIRLRNREGELTDCVVWGNDPATAAATLAARDGQVARLGGCVRLN